MVDVNMETVCPIIQISTLKPAGFFGPRLCH
jgi:hypothetical protein